MSEFTFAHEKKLGVGYLYLNSGEIARTVSVTDDIMVDLAEDGTIIGVEMLCLATVTDETVRASIQRGLDDVKAGRVARRDDFLDGVELEGEDA